MSKNVKLNKAIFGVMRDNAVRNPDIFKIENSIRPSRQFYAEKLRWWARKLGYEDYHIPVFMGIPATFVIIYQVAAFYFIYGEKPCQTHHGFFKDYFAVPFFYAAKTNPDSHFSNVSNMYTNDRLHGMMSLPKRPWEKFKDPENTIKRVAYRHNRENPEF